MKTRNGPALGWMPFPHKSVEFDQTGLFGKKRGRLGKRAWVTAFEALLPEVDSCSTFQNTFVCQNLSFFVGAPAILAEVHSAKIDDIRCYGNTTASLTIARASNANYSYIICKPIDQRQAVKKMNCVKLRQKRKRVKGNIIKSMYILFLYNSIYFHRNGNYPN